MDMLNSQHTAKKRKLEESFGSTDSDANGPGKKQKIDNNDNKIITKIYDWSSAFPTAFDIHEPFYCPAPKTVLEKQIIRYSCMVRSQTDWYIKMDNDEWVSEIKSKLKKKGAEDSIIQYVFDELEHHYKKLIDGAIFPTLVDGVYQADNIIDYELSRAFLSEFHDFLGSDEENFKVDGQHGRSLFYNTYRWCRHYVVLCPTICCYSFEQSKRQTEPFKLDLIVEKDPVLTKPFYSAFNEPTYSLQRFTHNTDRYFDNCDDRFEIQEEDLEVEEIDQEIQNFVSEWSSRKPNYQWLPAEFNISDDGKVTIESYINNMHPVRFAKMYNAIARIFEKFVPLFNKTLTDVLNPLPNRVQYDQIHEEVMALNESQRSLMNEISPLVPEYCPNKATSRTIVDLKGRRVQVITRMIRTSTRYSTPWQVDGMPHERIIATGVYCFDSEDNASMVVKFREPVVPPFTEARDTEVFGLELGATLIQQRGAVSFKQGGCVVYPNLWQHVENSEDVSLLYFHIVDPATPIISTAQVLPQQASWLINHRTFVEGTALAQLPTELLRIIFSEYKYGFTYPEAVTHRMLALEERRLYSRYNRLLWERRTYTSGNENENE